ncbi:hypothetical protein ACFYWU_33700 [Streptomyces chrestomyceticus]|uniref:hypothetical protein n=1 Tax=Streptomyces chrestomyceticus TaxID=68185 RepID=UPI00368360E7
MQGRETKFACPGCGYQRTSDFCWECDLAQEGDERTSILELAATAVTTAMLLPFLQALATKAGDDVWPKIRDLVRPGQRDDIEQSLADTQVLELVAADRRMIITMPQRMSAETAHGLQGVVRALTDIGGYYRVRYDAPTGTWDVTPANDEERALIDRQLEGG